MSMGPSSFNRQSAVAPNTVPMPGVGKGSSSLGSLTPPSTPVTSPVTSATGPAPAPTPPAPINGPQTPVDGYQLPNPNPTPPVSQGNFGTVQPQPAAISPVAMPTPNPVPMAPPANVPGSNVNGPVNPAQIAGGTQPMKLEDYISMGIDPATAQSIISGTAIR